MNHHALLRMFILVCQLCWNRESHPPEYGLGPPWWSDSKESACSVGDLDLILGWEDPLEKKTATHSSLLA